MSTAFCGYDWTTIPRTPDSLSKPEQIGRQSWVLDDIYYYTEYWVCPNGSAEIRRYEEEKEIGVEILPPGTWEVCRDWPTHTCRSGEFVSRLQQVGE